MAEQLKVDVIAKTLGIKSLNDLRAGFQMISQVINAVKGKAKELTDAYIVQEKEESQLNAVLKSTGMAAELTADERY